MTALVGVDPGYKRTGVVLRSGARCLGWRTVERGVDETEVGPGAVYIADVLAAVEFLASVESLGEYPRVAVEGLRKPNPHLGMTNATMIIAAGVVLGGVLARYPDAVLVPPGGNGSGALVSYPPELVTAAERRGGLNRAARSSSLVSHARSAFDVAGRASLMIRGAA